MIKVISYGISGTTTTPTTTKTAVTPMKMYQLKQKFMRKFYKAQNMMADLGGLLKGVLMLATILNFYFSEKNYA
jgi:hypothetical protein